MGNFKGTKGKWVITSGNPNGFELPAFKVQLKNEDPFDSWDICAVWNDLPSKEESKANALLISKAPEMLEMLEIIYQQVDFSFEAWGSDTGLKMEAEIKKIIKEATEL